MAALKGSKTEDNLKAAFAGGPEIVALVEIEVGHLHLALGQHRFHPVEAGLRDADVLIDGEEEHEVGEVEYCRGLWSASLQAGVRQASGVCPRIL